MEATGPGPRVDPRQVRFEMGSVAALLLGGFVFKQIWVIPAVALALAVGLGFGARANVFMRVFQLTLADRLKASPDTEVASAVRFSELFAVTALSVATLLWLVHLNLLMWLIALAEAGVCAFHAGTGVSVEAAIRARMTGRKRP
jgi:hypothetical protein